MLILSILLIFASMFLYMTVVIDMFKKKTWLGFLGLFLFPFTFYHLYKNYTGNRKRMGVMLTVAISLPLLYMQYESGVGNKELSPFFQQVRDEGSMECMKNSTLSSNAGITFYHVWCSPENIDDIKYVSETELVTKYKEVFVVPALESYKKTFGLIEDKGIILGIASPSKLYACYKIENPGEIVKSWSSFEPCG